LLTAAQALFALVVLLRLQLRAVEALLLFGAFAVQLMLPQPTMRLVFAGLYGAAALVLLAVRASHVLPTAEALGRDPRED
jgi:hypothetical protein